MNSTFYEFIISGWVETGAITNIPQSVILLDTLLLQCYVVVYIPFWILPSSKKASSKKCPWASPLPRAFYLGAVTLIFQEMKNILDRITGLT